MSTLEIRVIEEGILPVEDVEPGGNLTGSQVHGQDLIGGLEEGVFIVPAAA